MTHAPSMSKNSWRVFTFFCKYKLPPPYSLVSQQVAVNHNVCFLLFHDLKYVFLDDCLGYVHVVGVSGRAEPIYCPLPIDTQMRGLA